MKPGAIYWRELSPVSFYGQDASNNRARVMGDKEAQEKQVPGDGTRWHWQVDANDVTKTGIYMIWGWSTSSEIAKKDATEALKFLGQLKG